MTAEIVKIISIEDLINNTGFRMTLRFTDETEVLINLDLTRPYTEKLFYNLMQLFDLLNNDSGFDIDQLIGKEFIAEIKYEELRNRMIPIIKTMGAVPY